MKPKVSRSGYYYWLEYPISQRKKKDIQLKEEIRRIYDKSRKRYGSSRIHHKLLREDYHIGKKRVERLMQELDIQAVAKKKYKATTDSSHTRPVAGNHLSSDGERLPYLESRIDLSEIDMRPEGKPKGIYSNTLKFFTTGKDYIPL